MSIRELMFTPEDEKLVTDYLIERRSLSKADAQALATEYTCRYADPRSGKTASFGRFREGALIEVLFTTRSQYLPVWFIPWTSSISTETLSLAMAHYEQRGYISTYLASEKEQSERRESLFSEAFALSHPNQPIGVSRKTLQRNEKSPYLDIFVHLQSRRLVDAPIVISAFSF